MVLAGIGGGVANRYDRRAKQRINSCGYNKITTINRKAPIFLRGLLSLVHYGAEEEIRTPDPLLGNSITTVSQRLRMTIALSLIGT
jgi:hypothetical protein